MNPGVIAALILVLIGAAVIVMTPRHVPWPSEVNRMDTDE
jgi:hypothetical protein